MNLYMDDDCAKATPVALLRKAGHRVVTPADVGRAGQSDPRHFTYAVQQDLALLTRNHDDFEDLHEFAQAVGGQHAGLLVVRLDNDPARDMKDRDIVRAIGNLERAGAPVANEIHVLNHWR